jgi:hypothetical protein
MPDFGSAGNCTQAGQGDTDETLYFVAKAGGITVCILGLFLWWLIASINRGILRPQRVNALVIFVALFAAIATSILMGVVSLHAGQDFTDVTKNGMSFFRFYLIPVIQPTFVWPVGLCRRGDLDLATPHEISICMRRSHF